MISVVIPVKNGGSGIRRCLEAIRRQQVETEVEVIVIDSGSTDGTQELARSLGATVHQIEPGDFNHGGTRNLGAELARGEIVVFTVDDALPVGERWLDRLTAPLLTNSRLAGTYARQVAFDSAAAHQRFYIEYRYGPVPRIQRATSEADLTVSSVLFSNVSSAIRKSVLTEFPFASDIVIAEDLEWCSRVLLSGWEVAYVPEAIVQHSHDYTLPESFKRYFDQGAAAGRSYLAQRRSSARDVRGEGLRFVRRELAWMWSTGERRRIPSALAHEFSRYSGYQLGVHHERLPPRLKGRLSRTTTYWASEARSGSAGG